MRRKLFLRFFMQTHMVAHVDEIGFLGCQTLDIRQGFADALMGAVRLGALGIHHQHFQALQ